jgi:hypothetical protein
VGRLLKKARDLALEKAVLLLMRPKVERYGELLALKLDTSAKKLSAEIMLRGETLPLVVSEARYRIEQKRGETRLIVFGVKVSREWLQNLLDDELPEISIKVPDLARLLA